MSNTGIQTKSTNRRDDDQGMEINPVAAGFAGAVLGAGIAVVGAYAIRDKKTKDSLEQIMRTLGKKTGEYLKSIKTTATNQLGEKAEEAAIEVKEVVTKNNK